MPRRGVHELAFDKAVKDAPIRPQDAAAVTLARHHARILDDLVGEPYESREVARVGNSYLAVLEQLGMTTFGRRNSNSNKEQGEDSGPKNPLKQARDELAAQRAKRNAS